MTLSAERLVATARERAGLADFGDDSFREGLDRLAASLEGAGLTDLGRRITRARLVRLLVNRLRIEDVYRVHPDIDEQRIERPLFVIGLPRTGTTALSQLIASDPGIRSLRVWESGDPVPPPEEATQHTDPRIARTQVELDATYARYPDMRSLYFQTATDATECQDLLGMAFRTLHFDGMARVDSYTDWIMVCDMRPSYEYHRRTLKLLQWRCPPARWHLKTPVHMLSPDALDEIYPDAVFIWTHRDPARVLGSVCSLISSLRAMVSDRADPELGRRQLDLWAEAVRRSMAFRARSAPERFADVRFADLQADPIAAVRDAYERLGFRLTPEAETRMRTWREENPPGGRGTHEYSLEEFGLDAAAVRARFSEYTERFAVLLG